MNLFVVDPEWGWWIILYFYLGGIAAGSVLSSDHSNAAVVALIWIVIGVINVAYARRR